MTLVLMVAQAVAVECVDYSCRQLNYKETKGRIDRRELEMVYEVYGFIKIYREA